MIFRFIKEDLYVKIILKYQYMIHNTQSVKTKADIKKQIVVSHKVHKSKHKEHKVLKYNVLLCGAL
jgi:hypothetical protein